MHGACVPRYFALQKRQRETDRERDKQMDVENRQRYEAGRVLMS